MSRGVSSRRSAVTKEIPDKRVGTKAVLRLSVLVAEGIDKFNDEKETYVDLKVYEDVSLKAILEGIETSLLIQSNNSSRKTKQESSEKRRETLGENDHENKPGENKSNSVMIDNNDIRYLRKINSNVPLNMAQTMKESSIKDGDVLVLESTKKKRKRRSLDNTTDIPTSHQDDYDNNSGNDDNNDDIDESDILNVSCITRIVDSDGNPFKKLRILVSRNHCCSDFMEDVSNLWGKTGLKFKIGSKVLYPDKTFKKLNVEDFAEITVTGGRD